MTRYWSFKFLSPLFEKWNPTGSFFACWHLWKICLKGQNSVGFFEKKIGCPPPAPPIWKPVILRRGVWIKNGMSPEQKCKWPIKVELEHKTLARVTFIFSGSHQKFFFGVSTDDLLYLKPLKNVRKNAICLNLFCYKIFVHWKSKLLNVLVDSVLNILGPWRRGENFLTFALQ